ncbi:MAG: ferritin-like domain-containing protein [Gammaproteobacteria bacterium]|jgi:bacterioferritin
MNKQEFLKLLNEDLESEYRSIIQYIQHVNSINGARYQNVIDEMRNHLNQELDHALVLAKQIDFLGGTPSTHVARFPAVEEAEEALEQDLSLEESQLARYRERVQQATDLGYPDLAEALGPLLKETQDHVHELRSALDA